jgi:ATP-dependent DNA helicase RecG
VSPVHSTEQLVALVRELLELSVETEWLEDKENNENPEEIGQYLSALSNSAAILGRDYGYMLWGVRDGERRLVGTTFRPSQAKTGNEDLKAWLTRMLSPQVHFEFYELEIDDFPIVLMEVARAIGQPVKFKSEEYIRVGSYKKKLRSLPDHSRRLWKALEHAAFEDGIAADRVGPSDVLKMLDYPGYFDLMDIPLPESRIGIIDALSRDNLVKEDDSGLWSITNLGAILFAKRMDDFPSLERKALRVVQYKGNDRIETIKEQVGMHGYASGFKGMITYIGNLLPSNEVIGKALRQTVRMYPDLAVRELLANALIHQDFDLTGTGPMVEIFSERIEITNPGTPLIDPLRFVDSPPRSRNERLAALMRRMGICEERGSGWDKIAFEIEYHQLPAPLVEITEHHTRVILFSHRELKDMDRADRVRAVYLHACLRHVNREKVTNTSVRDRFGIDARNSAKASRLIKEAMEDGMIVPRDPAAARKLMEYVPSWAAPDGNPGLDNFFDE